MLVPVELSMVAVNRWGTLPLTLKSGIRVWGTSVFEYKVLSGMSLATIADLVVD